MVAKNFSNIAVNTELSSGIGASDTALTVDDASGWPAAPFALVIDPGETSEELILVGAKASNTFSTLTRGYGGTSASIHTASAVVKHVITAGDMSALYTHDHSGDYAAVDHSDLDGIDEDDAHPQYLLIDDIGSVEHHSLHGLGDDDHPQYLKASVFKASQVYTKAASKLMAGTASWQAVDSLQFFMQTGWTTALVVVTARLNAIGQEDGSVMGRIRCDADDDESPRARFDIDAFSGSGYGDTIQMVKVVSDTSCYFILEIYEDGVSDPCYAYGNISLIAKKAS
jgi:hypothetical protein